MIAAVNLVISLVAQVTSLVNQVIIHMAQVISHMAQVTLLANQVISCLEAQVISLEIIHEMFHLHMPSPDTRWVHSLLCCPWQQATTQNLHITIVTMIK